MQALKKFVNGGNEQNEVMYKDIELKKEFGRGGVSGAIFSSNRNN